MDTKSSRSTAYWMGMNAGRYGLLKKTVEEQIAELDREHAFCFRRGLAQGKRMKRKRSS